MMLSKQTKKIISEGLNMDMETIQESSLEELRSRAKNLDFKSRSDIIGRGNVTEPTANVDMLFEEALKQITSKLKPIEQVAQKS